MYVLKMLKLLGFKRVMISSSKSPPGKSPPCSLQASNSSAKASSLSYPEANLKHSEAYCSENVNQPMNMEKHSTGPAVNQMPDPMLQVWVISQASPILIKKRFLQQKITKMVCLERQTFKENFNCVKRPASEVNFAGQSSIKKCKLFLASVPINNKQASFKDDTKVHDDEDHIQISKRMEKLAASDKKSSAVKKVTIVISSSFNTTNKESKKVMEKSQDSKSSEVPPSSSEWQRWTTLVQSGVTCPPHYQPHGVMVLYKGKPVALTPEQERMNLSLSLSTKMVPSLSFSSLGLDTDYINKPNFKENFMSIWKKILGKSHIIQNLEDRYFTSIY
ncbi:topoisomerase I [Olea europaea subsp. europaea]|uniref:Topoisomerase I n=1 Tax=Olea europaea subsp. europaea TaxID=158383 RepID=A0A8S0PD86_OLEEU|nr:topoisomerase I [Olea europaea subsp. europaea]